MPTASPAGGGVARSIAHIGAYVATESDPLAARLWMFQEVTRWEDGRPALELGIQLAADLNAVGRAAEAAKVLVNLPLSRGPAARRQESATLTPTRPETLAASAPR